MNKILIAIIFLVLGFGGGYFIGSNNCSKINNDVAQIITPTIPSVPSSAPTAAISVTSTVTSTPPPTEKLFDTYNSAGVSNKPTAEAVFTIQSAKQIYLIQDYHWNNAKGKTPGTISLQSKDGKKYGPWQAAGAPGQGGVPDAYWTVYPDVELPAGTYTIVDSDPDSWAQNSGSNGVGMSQVYAVK